MVFRTELSALLVQYTSITKNMQKIDGTQSQHETAFLRYKCTNDGLLENSSQCLSFSDT